MHAAEDLHAAAAGGRPGASRVEGCRRGRVAGVPAEMADRLDRLMPPDDPTAEPEHPWCVLRRAHGYPTKTRERMDSPRDRRARLPISSGPIESWTKRLNERV